MLLAMSRHLFWIGVVGVGEGIVGGPGIGPAVGPAVSPAVGPAVGGMEGDVDVFVRVIWASRPLMELTKRVRFQVSSPISSKV